MANVPKSALSCMLLAVLMPALCLLCTASEPFVSVGAALQVCTVTCISSLVLLSHSLTNDFCTADSGTASDESHSFVSYAYCSKSRMSLS